MADLNIIRAIESTFQPNREAQGVMAPIERSKYYESVPHDARVAAVMAMLYPKDDQWHLVYIKRVSDERDKHAGQIGFPGGKYEEEDADYYQTALRETSEEVGVDSANITLIGQLADLYIPVSNFQVYSYLTYHPERPTFVPEPSEVAEIIEIPISYLMDPNIVGRTDIDIHGGTMNNIPYFDLQGRVLWGATAMLTNEIIFNLKKAI